MTLIFFLPRLFFSTGVSGGTQLGPKMAETLRALESSQYMTSSGIIVNLDKEKIFAGVRRSRLYEGKKIRRQIMDKQPHPVIRVVDADCLDEALRLKRQGLKPVVLDMADRDTPGGCKGYSALVLISLGMHFNKLYPGAIRP